jgi:hypothetical protein
MVASITIIQSPLNFLEFSRLGYDTTLEQFIAMWVRERNSSASNGGRRFEYYATVLGVYHSRGASLLQEQLQGGAAGVTVEGQCLSLQNEDEQVSIIISSVFTFTFPWIEMFCGATCRAVGNLMSPQSRSNRTDLDIAHRLILLSSTNLTSVV